MRCPRCRHETPPDAEFCPDCGARLTIACAACGTENAPEHRFCKRCGQPLVPASRQGPAAISYVSPRTYTPKHLAEKIISYKSALEGERKQVTVLFADLRGSMELLSERDPEEARTLLDPILEIMMEAVHRFEGTVNQVLGDGIMALFGAPLAHEDHAVRACYAALAMQSAVRSYAEEVRHTRGVEVQIREGLNSGEVVVRAIGNDLHMDYTAVGQTTHLAARMEQLAPAGTIRLTAETLRLAEGFVQVKPLGPVPVKGLPAPVEVFELIGTGPSRRRLQAATTRGLSRFVGRQNELEALQDALDSARAGRGQVVALVGEPGVGKSRLFWECAHSHRTHGWLILESGCASYGKGTPYLPLIDLLKSYFHIDGRDDGRKIREKVIGKLVTLDEALKPALPPFLALLEVPVEDPEWEGQDPLQRRRRTLDACKRLLLRESQIQPVLLIFEDLHWIDSETQAFLDSLVESLPTARLLLLVNYRPEYEHGWGNKTYYTQIRIDPLPAESAEELLHVLLGDDASLKPLKRLLIDQTEGNPFFLEESVRTLVETQVLVGDRGAYRAAKILPGIQVPATVQAVLAARIDRLPSEEKHLLQCAAVIGKDVPFVLLEAIAELPDEALRRGLSHLQAAEFLHEVSLLPEPEYTFRHALTHEVAYASLLQERRRALHAGIVQAIETLYPDRLAEQVGRLANHAMRGELWEKAAFYSRQAGLRALGRSANREAVECFEQALAALQRLPESRATLELGIDLRFDLRNSLYLRGEHAQILGYIREAEALAESLNDQRRLGWVAGYMALHFSWVGNYERAIESCQRVLSISASLGDFPLQVVANFYLGQAYYGLGEYFRAIECLNRNVTSLQGDLVRERFGLAGPASVLSLTFLAICLASVGRFSEGEVHAAEGVRIAESVDHLFGRIAADASAGFVSLVKGEADKAIPVLERALHLCQTAEVRLWVPAVASALGHAYTLSGRAAEAVPLLEQAVEQSASMNLLLIESNRVARLAEAYLLTCRTEKAIDFARRALELSLRQHERGNQAYILRVQGEIAARQDPPDAASAEVHFGQAIALAEALGMRPLLAQCHSGLARMYQRTGNEQKAEGHRSAASVLLREMGLEPTQTGDRAQS